MRSSRCTHVLRRFPRLTALELHRANQDRPSLSPTHLQFPLWGPESKDPAHDKFPVRPSAVFTTPSMKIASATNTEPSSRDTSTTRLEIGWRWFPTQPSSYKSCNLKERHAATITTTRKPRYPPRCFSLLGLVLGRPDQQPPNPSI